MIYKRFVLQLALYRIFLQTPFLRHLTQTLGLKPLTNDFGGFFFTNIACKTAHRRHMRKCLERPVKVSLQTLFVSLLTNTMFKDFIEMASLRVRTNSFLRRPEKCNLLDSFEPPCVRLVTEGTRGTLK